MKAAAALVAAIALGSPAWAQDQRRPRPVRNEVRIVVEESPEGDYDHDYYEQALPVEFRTGPPGVTAGVWYRTVCRPQEEDRAPIFLPPPSAPPAVPPLRISVAAGMPRLSVTTQRSAASFVPGGPRTDPIITKPALFGGGGGSDTVTSSDAPMLYGPEFDLVIVGDLTGWSPTQWMPAGTSLHLFARTLFGSFEVFDTPSSLQLYSLGPRLAVPVAKAGSLEVGVTVSAGPAFLHTGIGDAVGFDGGIGLRVEQVFTPGISFVASVEANLYFSENVSAFGPVVNLGFNISW